MNFSKIVRAISGPFVFFSALPVSIAFAGVTISSNNLSQNVLDPSAGFDFSIYTGTVIPTNDAIGESVGGASSQNTVVYSAAGGLTSLSYTFSHLRPGFGASLAQSRTNSLFFTVDADSTYELSGYYIAGDFGAPDRVYFQTLLVDITGPINTLAYSRQESLSTSDEAFVLGGAGGDHDNLFQGSLTGDLLVGRSYRWDWDAFIEATQSNGGAFAGGAISLNIREAALVAVFEPTSLPALCLGLVGLVWARRRRQRNKNIPVVVG